MACKKDLFVTSDTRLSRQSNLYHQMSKVGSKIDESQHRGIFEDTYELPDGEVTLRCDYRDPFGCTISLKASNHTKLTRLENLLKTEIPGLK